MLVEHDFGKIEKLTCMSSLYDGPPPRGRPFRHYRLDSDTRDSCHEQTNCKREKDSDPRPIDREDLITDAHGGHCHLTV